MANRPRLPNVDPEELSKLASQYPGSSGASERNEPSMGPTSAGLGASSGSTSGLAGSGSRSTVSSGDAKVGSGGSRAGGTSSRPSDGVKQPEKRARGSWFAAFVTFIFAIVAVAAALLAVGGPSYRAEIRMLLMQYVPQLEQDMVNLVTGHDPDRLEVTFEGLDQRIDTLTSALERVAAVEGLTPDAARELLLRTEQNIRLDDVVGRLADQAAVVADVPRQAEAISALKAEQDAAVQGLAAASEETRAELATARQSFDALAERLTSVEGGIEGLQAADGELMAQFAALDGQLQTLAADVTLLAQSSERIAQLVSARQDQELPVLAVLQLEKALEGSAPYGSELAFARRYLGDRPDAALALDTLADGAGGGVNSLADLRRDFMLIANQMGSTVGRLQSWTDRMTGWFEMLVGASSVPEVSSGGRLTTSIATVDAALERGDLALAIQETSAILAVRRSGALEEWLGVLRKRHDMTVALGALNDAVYGRDVSGSQNQGAGKTN